MEPRPSLAKLAALLAAGVSVLVLAGSAEGSSGSNSAKGWIAVEGGGELRALNAQTGRRRRLAVFVESEAAWSRDGRKLAYVADGALRAMSFRSGKQRVITRLRGRFSTGSAVVAGRGSPRLHAARGLLGYRRAGRSRPRRPSPPRRRPRRFQLPGAAMVAQRANDRVPQELGRRRRHLGRSPGWSRPTRPRG